MASNNKSNNISKLPPNLQNLAASLNTLKLQNRAVYNKGYSSLGTTRYDDATLYSSSNYQSSPSKPTNTAVKDEPPVRSTLDDPFTTAKRNDNDDPLPSHGLQSSIPFSSTGSISRVVNHDQMRPNPNQSEDTNITNQTRTYNDIYTQSSHYSRPTTPKQHDSVDINDTTVTALEGPVFTTPAPRHTSESDVIPDGPGSTTEGQSGQLNTNNEVISHGSLSANKERLIADSDRAMVLEREFNQVRQVNQVLEGVIESLNITETNLETVLTATQNADRLLSNWISILSQTHHTRSLLLDSDHWSGLTNDIEQQEREVILEQERRRDQQLREKQEEEERERERVRRELEREVREKDEVERRKRDEVRKAKEERERKRREALYGTRKLPNIPSAKETDNVHGRTGAGSTANNRRAINRTTPANGRPNGSTTSGLRRPVAGTRNNGSTITNSGIPTRMGADPSGQSRIPGTSRYKK